MSTSSTFASNSGLELIKRSYRDESQTSFNLNQTKAFKQLLPVDQNELMIILDRVEDHHDFENVSSRKKVLPTSLKKKNTPQATSSKPNIKKGKINRKPSGAKTLVLMETKDLTFQQLPSHLSHLIPQRHLNPRIILPRLMGSNEAEMNVVLRNVIENVKWPTSLWGLRQAMEGFWNILSSSPCIRGGKEFFEGPLGLYYRPLVMFSGRTQRLEISKTLKSWSMNSGNGVCDWTTYDWKPNEATTPTVAAIQIKSSLRSHKFDGKPIVSILEAEIKKGLTKGGRFTSNQNAERARHCWNLVVETLHDGDQSYTQVVKIDSLYNVIPRDKDKAFMEAFNKDKRELKGFRVRDDIDEQFADYECLKEHICVAIRVLFLGDSCRKKE